jgi:predicted PurR-regulated permease PerM
MLAGLVVAFAGVLAYLSDPPTRRHYVKRLCVIVILLLTLIGLGAVFGKTLGDFLRNVNG